MADDLGHGGRPLVDPTQFFPARPRARAAEPFYREMSRESTTSTEADGLLAMEQDSIASGSGEATALVTATRSDESEVSADQETGVEISELPSFALRLLGGPLPEVWPAAAAALTWRLQRLAICILMLLAPGTILVIVAFVRGVEAWQASAGMACHQPLRWWLVGHVSILAIGMIGCCSGAAFVGLAGWIAWGIALLSRRQTDKCPPVLVQGVKEALVVEFIVFALALLLACLAAFAARTARQAHRLCQGYVEPWAPEAHLEFQEAESFMEELAYTDRGHGMEDGKDLPRADIEDSGSPYDRECAICYEAFAEIGGVIARAACGHRFHKTCILEWLRNHRTCPLCRHRVDKPIGWEPHHPVRVFGPEPRPFVYPVDSTTAAE
jgi:hypothetical protein